ncbi:MAG: dethiobiotin synthase, partial [Desulfobacterales bacterium]|nr:dethiobiotin synthase [Desulfobacterales bacterium]
PPRRSEFLLDSLFMNSRPFSMERPLVEEDPFPDRRGFTECLRRAGCCETDKQRRGGEEVDMNPDLSAEGRNPGSCGDRERGVLFVCGTGTSVGKTFVCARLLDFLLRNGVDAGYQKWVSTGEQGRPADLEYCLRAAGLAPDPALLDLQVPYRFLFPASPHLAAEREGRRVDPAVIVESYRKLRQRHRFLLVEGVGGLLVPLTRELLLIDLVALLRIPVLVVAASGLGTLNHSLLTLEALRAREIPVAGVVFSDGPGPEDELLIRDNIHTVAELGRVEVFGRLRRVAGDAARREFEPVGAALLANGAVMPDK